MFLFFFSHTAFLKGIWWLPNLLNLTALFLRGCMMGVAVQPIWKMIKGGVDETPESPRISSSHVAGIHTNENKKKQQLRNDDWFAVWKFPLEWILGLSCKKAKRSAVFNQSQGCEISVLAKKLIISGPKKGFRWKKNLPKKLNQLSTCLVFCQPEMTKAFR